MFSLKQENYFKFFQENNMLKIKNENSFFDQFWRILAYFDFFRFQFLFLHFPSILSISLISYLILMINSFLCTPIFLQIEFDFHMKLEPLFWMKVKEKIQFMPEWFSPWNKLNYLCFTWVIFEVKYRNNFIFKDWNLTRYFVPFSKNWMKHDIGIFTLFIFKTQSLFCFSLNNGNPCPKIKLLISEFDIKTLYHQWTEY
jgi:hypothetical protein